MNYITRHRNHSSGCFFVSGFKKNAPNSLDDLKEDIANGDTSFVDSLTYYSHRVKGSSTYWGTKRSQVYSWINHHVEKGHGAPMFFITLSCAEYYWKDVIDLLKERMELAGEDSSMCYVGSPHLVQIVNDYSVVVQEYFQKRVETWLKTVGSKIFGIDHYWARYEFAPGRGQIHVHLLAISRDQEIYEICNLDVKEDNGEMVRALRLQDWLTKKINLTASVQSGFDHISLTNENSPCSIRFSDLEENESTIIMDGQKLLKFCEIHQCSQFCMRDPKEG